ncbi:TetR/AcrR family transcriptional regulator [Catenulispora sp. NF23]|uniref:TetR/AcrR family transcriptional regulator n=1 Tax=Catenulispora pinistramenti TaxID=2705254 RepID=UPI001BA814B2|nr:TetR family transcriptional regulator [Catenulispora pinistramenti]MBS2536126.1 TetR/AcrR family transcriptional regulator [Catenulispora pinistramenti]
MTVHPGALSRSRRATKRPLLDVVAEVLLAQPGASLAEVAEFAGISRTTLHKHYATRDELVRAVGQRATEIWEQAVDRVADEPGTKAGLRQLLAAMIESGPQLTFLWRNPALDEDNELTRRYIDVENRCLAVLDRARKEGVLAATTPDWWLLQTLYALVYTAAESIQFGKLAPLDAPDLALSTLLNGLGAPATGAGSGKPDKGESE